MLTVAKFFGLHAALVLMVQLLLVARLPWLDRRLGMDRLTAWHRWVGFAVFWAVVLHPTLILLGYSRLYKVSFIDQFVDFTGVPATLYGMLAVSVIIVSSRKPHPGVGTIESPVGLRMPSSP